MSSSSPKQADESKQENGQAAAADTTTCTADASGNENGDDDEENVHSNNNDLVIREGFPALFRSDGKGPLIDGDEPMPARQFSSFQKALTLTDPQNQQLLLEDCSTVFSARTKESGAAYSVGCTYFCPCLMKPRCALEALALEIFQSHVSSLPYQMYDPERSGAEWWTLVMDAATGTKQEDEEENSTEENEDDDEVGMHFDADYGLESQLRHMLLHPRLATVTYLSNVGAPTVIFDRRSPLPADVSKASLAGNIKKGWLSGPQFGKHIAFDGRLLHGAPATFFPGVVTVNDTVPDGDEPAAKRQKTDSSDFSEAAPAQQRVTFLVNIWLNHCPMDAELLDDEVIEQLKTPWQEEQESKPGQLKEDDGSTTNAFEWKLGTPDDTPTVKLIAHQPDPAGSEETVICHREVTIKFNASMDDLHKAAQATNGGVSVNLEMAENAISIDVGKEVESSDEEEEAGGE